LSRRWDGISPHCIRPIREFVKGADREADRDDRQRALPLDRTCRWARPSFLVVPRITCDAQLVVHVADARARSTLSSADRFIRRSSTGPVSVTSAE
jgi:hypothetical protein